MARRTKEDAEATRQQILDSAEHVFAAKGVAHTTMADIAADAGVSRGALYWHFTSKTDIFHAMFIRQHDANKVVCAAARNPEEADPLAQMRSILSHFLRKVVDDPQQRRVSEILHHWPASRPTCASTCRPPATRSTRTSPCPCATPCSAASCPPTSTCAAPPSPCMPTSTA